ncbi:uncharacterized protein LOC111629154 [Centruroides sculpturatus]|nr:uncharacterized protein LOC111629154 [Centruroides sculpturatus]
MKTLLALVIVFFAVASIHSCNNIDANNLFKQFCNIRNRQAFNYCLRENNVNIINDLHRNCIMQVKYYKTMDELKNFICNGSTEEELTKYFHCFYPAIYVENIANPNLLDINRKCLKEVSKYY